MSTPKRYAKGVDLVLILIKSKNKNQGLSSLNNFLIKKIFTCSFEDLTPVKALNRSPPYTYIIKTCKRVGRASRATLAQQVWYRSRSSY